MCNIFFLFLIALATIMAILLPIIYSQLSALIAAIPEYFQIFANDFYPKSLILPAI